MKILLLNGSPHASGATARALDECEKELKSIGCDTERLSIGKDARYSCTGCGGCVKEGRCIFGDLDTLYRAFESSDAIIIGAPTHFGGAPSNLLSVLSRLVFSKKSAASGKPVAAIGVGRRGCISTAIYEIEKYFRFCFCPIVSAGYPAILYAKDKDSAEYDFEGLQNMREVARRIHWLSACIAIGKERGTVPKAPEPKIKTDISTLT